MWREAGWALLVPATGPAHGLGAGAGRGRRGLGVGRRGWEAVEAGVPRQELGSGRGPGQGTGRTLGGRWGLAEGGALAPAAPRRVPLPAAGGWRRGPGQRPGLRRHRAPAAAGAEGRGAHGGQRCPCGGERGRSGGMPPLLDPRGAGLPTPPPRHVKGLIASDQRRGTAPLGVWGMSPACGHWPLSGTGESEEVLLASNLCPWYCSSPQGLPGGQDC